jgi:hypothetical protein
MNNKYFNYYIDDTGTKEMQNTTRPFFDYVGLMIEQNNEKLVVDNVHAIKSKYFNTTKVEIKSTWLRIPEKRKEKYLDPYQISNDELNNFTEELYNRLIKLKIVIKTTSTIKERPGLTAYGAGHGPAITVEEQSRRCKGIETEGRAGEGLGTETAEYCVAAG